MTIICRPIGRGNWRTIRFDVDGGLFGLLGMVRVNDRFQLGGITWRVCAISE